MAYRLWRLDGGSPRIIVSRDVTFRDEIMYKDAKKNDHTEVTLDSQGTQSEVELQASDRVDRGSSGASTSSTKDTDYCIARDRPRRDPVKPIRFRQDDELSAFVFNVIEEENIYEPLTYEGAMMSNDKDRWERAMQEEMQSLWDNKTWKLVDKLVGHKLVDCKWLFKVKEGVAGELPRYKARLVAKGYTKKAGVDYNKIFLTCCQACFNQGDSSSYSCS
jgi:hypothetical protein